MEKVNERYMFGEENDNIYVIADGKRYLLTCHPYEPCLYITDESGIKTAVRNAFDPTVVLECFSEGRTVTSISGFEYDAKDFCEMVEYAAGKGNIGIEIAEKVFKDRPKKKKITQQKQETDRQQDEFYELIDRYPDCVIDYLLVKNEHLSDDYNSHWLALAIACGKLFSDDGEVIWNCDIGRAIGKRIEAARLFAPIEKNGKLNYRRAFLNPPYGKCYTEKDFDLINTALFPNGIDGLSVYEWTTDWSDYFDDGHEWWGTLCYTVYDKTLDRFAVILASSTD